MDTPYFYIRDNYDSQLTERHKTRFGAVWEYGIIAYFRDNGNSLAWLVRVS